MTPIIFFNMIAAMIEGAFQTFYAGIYMVDGRDLGLRAVLCSTIFMSMHFNGFKMGYGCALAWVLFLIIMVFTLIVFRSSDMWGFTMKMKMMPAGKKRKVGEIICHRRKTGR